MGETGSESAAIIAMARSCHGTKKMARFNFNGSNLDDRGGVLFFILWVPPVIDSMAGLYHH
jgi:hypothetical protein